MFNPQKLFSSFVPEQYKPLLSCISPSAFKVVKWQDLASEAPLIAKRIATGEGVKIVAEGLKPHLSNRLTLHSDAHSSLMKGSSLLPEDGFSLLELYFAQFKNESGLFLDLRPSSFFLMTDGNIHWQPNGLWIRFRPQFREGMLSIYSGYYLKNPERMRAGLQQVGLIKEHFSKAQVSEVEQMILSHIGGETSNQSFRVLHFTQGFEKLFQFLLREKIVLPPDFLYLGVYLASLYLHLESLGGSYDVRQAFLNNKFNI